uniref:Uncharacterized protein n=1 Tax=Glossina pallidipes TaxID=7398 RepID=A0A1A9ZJE1_GLOPL
MLTVDFNRATSEQGGLLQSECRYLIVASNKGYSGKKGICNSATADSNMMAVKQLNSKKCQIVYSEAAKNYMSICDKLLERLHACTPLEKRKISLTFEALNRQRRKNAIAFAKPKWIVCDPIQNIVLNRVFTGECPNRFMSNSVGVISGVFL